MKKLFGGINLTWKRLIILSIIMGIYTAVMAIVPALLNSSFGTITVTFEVWILFGILIIMNSKSNKEAALKCFVFFLISQPLVYLIQAPFSEQGLGLFRYYGYWFIWTILCLPMGYIGYYMKKDKWWGYLILLPMLLITLNSYSTYLAYFMFSYPKYILISLFCIIVIYLYPLVIFKNKQTRIISIILGTVLIVTTTIFRILNPLIYEPDILSNGNECHFDNTYKVYLVDKKYGELSIRYVKSIQDYMVHAKFKKEGNTKFVLESPDGKKRTFKVKIKRDTYDYKEVKE